MQQRRLLPPPARPSDVAVVRRVLLPLAEEGDPESVVEEVDEEEEREEVEEAVVARDHDENLKQRHCPRSSMPDDPKRADEEEGDRDLDHKDEGDAELEKERMELPQVPGHGGRDGLRGEVVGEGGQLLPDAVLGSDLDDAAHEHQLEEEEAKHPEGNARHLGAAARTSPERSVHDGEEACLEEEGVPLEVHEHVSNRCQGQVQHTAREDDRSCPEADGSDRGDEEAEDGEEVAQEVLVYPKCRMPPHDGGVELPAQAARELELLGEGEDALAAVEPLELDEVGGEGDEEHEPQPLQKDRSRFLVCRWSLLLVCRLRCRFPLPPHLLQQRSKSLHPLLPPFTHRADHVALSDKSLSSTSSTRAMLARRP
mmetsp:Transcript_21816/g.72132  ORF Transcript_21816/g.72132 Transcript_21816/m.72132 type:complete len:369 (+) Transcript_21816:3268-4374(+)